jgi:hypothetical protein
MPTCQEEQEEECESSVDEQALLALRHAVGAQAVLLILSKASHHLDAALKLGLLRATDGAAVFLGEVLLITTTSSTNRCSMSTVIRSLMELLLLLPPT